MSSSSGIAEELVHPGPCPARRSRCGRSAACPRRPWPTLVGDVVAGDRLRTSPARSVHLVDLRCASSAIAIDELEELRRVHQRERDAGGLDQVLLGDLGRGSTRSPAAARCRRSTARRGAGRRPPPRRRARCAVEVWKNSITAFVLERRRVRHVDDHVGARQYASPSPRRSACSRRCSARPRLPRARAPRARRPASTRSGRCHRSRRSSSQKLLRSPAASGRRPSPGKTGQPPRL